MTRPYRMKLRAERQADTRRRIVQAAVHLHRTLGPERTTVSDIARLAGVERPTVVRHFRDRLSLFMACSLYDMQENPLPDPAAWAKVDDPEARLKGALSEEYAYYRRQRVLLSQIRDMVEGDDELAPVREAMRQRDVYVRTVLAEGWPASKSARDRLLVAIAHALSFWAWLSLADLGLADDEAAGLMVDMVRGVIATPGMTPARKVAP
jgi:AcrR family transcriptional regulator